MASSPAAAPRSETTNRKTVAEIRAHAAALLAEGCPDEAFEYLLAALAALLDTQRNLELLVAKLRRERVGRKSERIDPAQLMLLFEQCLEESAAERENVDPKDEAREDDELNREINAANPAQRQKSPKRRRRTVVGSSVAREAHEIPVAENERGCPTCGEPRPRIGHDVTRRLEYVPGHFVEHEYRLEKIACARCKDGVATAIAPAQILPRSSAGASLLAAIVVGKFVDHSPLHRLAQGFRRVGVDIPSSTLSDWVAGTADILTPVVEALAARVLEARVVRSDGSGLRVLDGESPDNVTNGTMWCYVGDDRDVLFRYTRTGEGETGPWRFLAGRTGYVQVDAASVFDRLFKGQVASAIEVSCFSHGRRKLEALQDSDPRVAYPLKLIARLYRLETLADAKGLSPPERTRCRRERSKPVLEKLRRWLERTVASDVPSSAIVKAARYFLNHWTGLTRFVDDGILDLDNNLCEQQIRDLAVGRKNYLFAGSHESAERIALLYSLTRTCAQHGVPPLPYLTDVLTKLAAGWPQERIAELLPDRWQAGAAANASQSAGAVA